jgi:formylglycine-generating enzyme required for sulfatase activity
METCPPPAYPGEEVLQIHLNLKVDAHLELELASEKLPVIVRERRRAGNLHLDLRGAGMVGDNIGLGQEGASIGNQIHISGLGENLDDWLQGEPASSGPQPLRLHIAREICHPWVSPHGIRLRGIPAGQYVRGTSRQADPHALPEEEPRCVTLSRSFWMSAHPITNRQYSAVRGMPSPAQFESHKAEDAPVTCVSWEDAEAFCEELTLLERQAGTLPPGYAYRLPTEAEWERACRAGGEGPKHRPRYGLLPKIAALKAHKSGFGKVGRFLPNDWGLYDMLGLVHEWCLDISGPYPAGISTDPLRLHPEPGKPRRRILRGGCYMSPVEEVRASARFESDPGKRSHRVGFRVVLAPEMPR